MTIHLATSWDDGHSSDLRIADVLSERGVHGTFYVLRENHERPALTARERADLAAHPLADVGAHGLTHRRLTRMPPAEAEHEIAGSKAWLEDELGRPVEMFCYSGGLFSSWMPGHVKSCGYLGARTTRGHRLDLGDDPYALPTSMQVYPHSSWVHQRHSLRLGHFDEARDAWHLGRHRDHRGAITGLLKLAARREAKGVDSVLHLWGHSWEIEQLDLWRDVSEILSRCLDAGAVAVTNSQLAQQVRREQ
jgi:peptidoglycan/xylan/chitin deacetylase (PgdA/CDA1 family)